MMAVRTIEVRERVLAKNEELAQDVRQRLRDAGVRAFNLVSSPGSGKTTLLERTLATLGDEIDIAVVTGDVQTQNDADRLARHTDRLVQAVITNGACHLDARQVATALEAIDLSAIQLLFIENVGNLVCPAEFSLGEDFKAMILSVAEGDDKPLKYPLMFHESRVLVINKIDLLPFCECNPDLIEERARKINPNLTIFRVSCRTGEGLDRWTGWLKRQVKPEK